MDKFTEFVRSCPPGFNLSEFLEKTHKQIAERIALTFPHIPTEAEKERITRNAAACYYLGCQPVHVPSPQFFHFGPPGSKMSPATAQQLAASRPGWLASR